MGDVEEVDGMWRLSGAVIVGTKTTELLLWSALDTTPGLGLVSCSIDSAALLSGGAKVGTLELSELLVGSLFGLTCIV